MAHPHIDHKSIAPPALPPTFDSISEDSISESPLTLPTPAPQPPATAPATTSAPTVGTAAAATPTPPMPPAVSTARTHGSQAWNGSNATIFGESSSPWDTDETKPQVRVDDPIDEDDQPIFDGHTIFTAFPSWLVSMTVHLLIVLMTALFMLPSDPAPRPFELVLGEASAPLAEMDELASVEFDSFEAEPTEDPSDFEEEVEPIEELAEEFDPMDDLTDALSDNADMMEEALSAMTTTADLDAKINSGGSPSGGATAAPTIAGGLGLRSTQTRLNQVISAGGSEESEEAVARALRWLAKMQRNDGGWDLRDKAGMKGFQSSSSRNGATGLALLPFLGAGHTHKHGEYRYVVERGLQFLQKRMKVRGQGNTAMASLTDSRGNYYSHGLCTIAMCEDYAMTRDKTLRIPAQQLINEVVDAQDPRGGGWRYSRRSSGDTSVLGWQLMALKSGRMAYLQVPEKSFKGATRFLNSVQQNYGATYGYTSPAARPARAHSTTAVGLLSRMYLGWRRERPAMTVGVNQISNHGPNKDEIYFSYYGTQVMHHFGGPLWDEWNVEMRDSLVNSQTRRGANDGSWKLQASHENSRLYCTSMATMILEVYYRHMPLYKQHAANGRR